MAISAWLRRGKTTKSAERAISSASEMMRDVYRANGDRFRLFCPDETNSNRLGAVFEASDRAFMERVVPEDGGASQKGPAADRTRR